MIKFIEGTHQYIDTETNKELISVSEFTKSFQEKVDWKAIARKSAAKKTIEGNPTTEQELLQQWDRKRDISAKVGTLYHSIREKEAVENQPVFYNTLCQTKQCLFDGEHKFSIPINRLENNTIYPELMIYDMDGMICGQADKVVVHDNKISVLDYKTDKEISFAAYSSKWVQPRRFLPPISHLDDCNGNIYSLKMSLYMYMLWKSNKGRLRVGDIVIEHIHLKRDDEGLPLVENDIPLVEKIETIQLPYRKKEVMDMLSTLKL